MNTTMLIVGGLAIVALGVVALGGEEDPIYDSCGERINTGNLTPQSSGIHPMSSPIIKPFCSQPPPPGP